MIGKLETKHKVDKEKYDYFGVAKKLARFIERVSLFSFLIAVPKGIVRLISIPEQELTEDEKLFKMKLAANFEDLESLGLRWQETKIGREFWQYKDSEGNWQLILGVYVCNRESR